MKKMTGVIAPTTDNRYGSTTTIGARQSLLILQIGAMGSTRLATLNDLNGLACHPAVEALKARGLVTQRGTVLRLSAAGTRAREELSAVKLPTDSPVGLVLCGQKDKRGKK